MTFCQQPTVDRVVEAPEQPPDDEVSPDRDEVSPDRIDGQDLGLLLNEVNHRIRNLLAMIEAVIGLTQSATVEEYRTKVMARISGFGGFYEVICRLDGRKFGIAELLEQTMRPYCAIGGRVLAAGPDVDLEPRLALALHLVVHELATNASKYGALSASCGYVKVGWEILELGGAAPKLAVLWTEHGGPEVKYPRRPGFGSRLITSALVGYGEARLDFDVTGIACYMLIDLNRTSRASG